MNNQHTIVVGAALAAAVVAVAEATKASARQTTYSTRSDTCSRIKQSNDMDGWYMRNLRCCKDVFLLVVAKISNRWLLKNEPLHHNTIFDIEDRVAVTLYYVTHGDGFAVAGQIFGISSTRDHCYVSQVVAVILSCLEETVYVPRTTMAWMEIARGFEERGGIPNVVGVIDGCLVMVKRFKGPEGWYCRKGFPAFNMQGVVDDRLRFMSYSIRSGSQNDKCLFNNLNSVSKRTR
ncbi:hypothetical protein Ae201684P_006514 [Aphanomyces euteiches]|uniref:DDE Tnp4 domain-containing protein n=1 Tax=Aphanomyces euteiches TaxID=100861 RepID=A0A6G0XB73_9STRA|nr:hypothetical protein Ae201684_006574 [Aphanomyces euteiches]KAH9091114.1 hypothetical protein Ae201684P_006514 [Aphanomyces euteiches]